MTNNTYKAAFTRIGTKGRYYPKQSILHGKIGLFSPTRSWLQLDTKKLSTLISVSTGCENNGYYGEASEFYSSVPMHNAILKSLET